MKRSTLAALLLGAAGLTGACSDSTTEAGVAGLSGTYDLTLVDQLVFVTSQDRNELRVLDLGRSPREFTPAPNPLEPLSVPVLERPDSLTRDVGYDEDSTPGDEVPGPYVYARSSGGRQISVVAAARERLSEVKRLDTGALLTAFAARAPLSGVEGAPSMLYYTVQTLPPAAQPLCGPFGGGVVMRQPLAGPDALAAGTPEPAVPVFCLKSADTVLSMLVLPRPAGAAADAPDTLVLSIRNVTGTSRTVRTVADGTSQETPYLRPQPGSANPSTAPLVNVPTRLLATHERYEPDDKTSVAPGRYVFAALDELTCTGADCTGVIALDNGPTNTGPFQLAQDVSGAPMLNILPPAGVPSGLTLRRGLDVIQRQDDGTTPVAAVPLLGIMPSSDGSITLFRADERREFNLSTGIPTATLDLRTAAEASVTQETTGVIGVKQAGCKLKATDTEDSLCPGSVPARTLRFVYQALLPNLVDLTRDPTSTTFDVDATAAADIKAGQDIIVLESDTEDCPEDVTIQSVVTDTATGRATLIPLGALPPACAAYPRFSVRVAGSDEPVIILDEVGTPIREGGEIVRLTFAGARKSYFLPATPYYYHVNDFTRFPNPAPPIEFSLTTNKPRELVRGDRYVVTLTPNLRPYVFTVDTGTGSNLTAFRLPGPVVATQVGDVTQAYIVYPSADGILQANLELVTDNTPNLSALRAFQ